MYQATFEPDTLAKLKEQAKNMPMNQKSTKKFNKYNVDASVWAMQGMSKRLSMGMAAMVNQSLKYTHRFSKCFTAKQRKHPFQHIYPINNT